MHEIDLSTGWKVLQDVHDLGEVLGLYKPDFETTVFNAVSDWEPLLWLTHLQLLFAEQPYFGRELRYLNEHAWWYRLDFDCPEEAGSVVRLVFEGVDYFAKVWLNGEYLGEHEGYFEPFGFGIESKVRRGGTNVLIVKVWSPWDEACRPGEEYRRLHHIIRNLVKGTYEHCDTFIARDVNPVGIWRPVKLILSDGCYSAGGPEVDSSVSADMSSADVSVAWSVGSARGMKDAELEVRIEEEDSGLEVARSTERVTLVEGSNELKAHLELKKPRIWSTWDQGKPSLYRARISLTARGQALLEEERVFGVRTVGMRRTAEETSVWLNGRKIFVRGTTYFADVYLSRMDRGRYERDLTAMVRAGVNAVRVHVHVEDDAFYEICDRLGLLVLQDTDLNWLFPTDEAFLKRALAVVSAMVRALKHHPSIMGWVCINEGHFTEEPAISRFAQALEERFKSLDPARPTIRVASLENELTSGDSHYYDGGLGGGAYTNIVNRHHKLLSEFGFDAPAAASNLMRVPRLARRLAAVLPRIPELHRYQYRAHKFQIEHLRIHKYDPCSGFFQFMWIDLCPQSFYGVYDYWGCEKAEGGKGGLDAFLESCAPIGIFLEYLDRPVAIWAVNDLPRSLAGCRAEWTVTTDAGVSVARGSKVVDLGTDERTRVTDLSFPIDDGTSYHVRLSLADAQGAVIARNSYDDPFHHLGLVPGYPERMDHDIGVRLWNA